MHFLADSSIEVVGDFLPGEAPAHVLFDFDGTLSLIREGWPDIMVPMMVEFLQATGTDEAPDILEAVCSSFVMELTGKQTIYQMIRLADEVTLRGGIPLDPLEYKSEYHDWLMRHIETRREGLRTGEALGPNVCPRKRRIAQSVEALRCAALSRQRYRRAICPRRG